MPITILILTIRLVVSWVAPAPDMWYLDDRGRESWDWDGQQSAIWQGPTSRDAGVVQSRLVAPLRGRTRRRKGEVIVVVVVVDVVAVFAADNLEEATVNIKAKIQNLS